MSTESIIRNAKVLLRADAIIAEIHLRALIARSGLQLLAVLVGLFGAIMLGVAAFLALETIYGPVLAAVIVGVGALLVAALLFVIAGRVRLSRDLELARELRASAMDALMLDVKTLEADVLGFARAVRNPLDGALPGLIIPLVSMLMKTLRRSGPPPDKP
jgi:hypothetical protein